MTGLLAGHADWLARQQAAADQPPRRPRLPLRWHGHVIGSVEPDFLSRIDLTSTSNGPVAKQQTRQDGACGWDIEGDLTTSLAHIAQSMRAAGLAHAWRDEQLAVVDAQGSSLGTVERAAVRPLGIATAAVHLAGFTQDGRHWVQQRSLTKPNDPGLWDTLMGGMVPASDSIAQALERETWEEAGLRMDQLEQVAWGGRFMMRRPADDVRSSGYVVERIDWYRCVLADGVVPVNQDGEVAQFRSMPADEVVARLLQDEFTLEAALVLAAAGL